MLSVTETLEIQRGLKKLEIDLTQVLHITHDGNGMPLPDSTSKVFNIVLDWMEENVEHIEFKTPPEGG